MCYVVGIGNQNTKQLGRSKLGGTLLNGLLSQISVSCLFHEKTREICSSNCMNYIELGERSISRKNTILLPLFLLLPLVVVAWPFINFVSVQLSMITGKASIIILVVSAAYLIYSSATKSESAAQQQQLAMLFTFCAWLLAKCSWHGGRG